MSTERERDPEALRPLAHRLRRSAIAACLALPSLFLACNLFLDPDDLGGEVDGVPDGSAVEGGGEGGPDLDGGGSDGKPSEAGPSRPPPDGSVPKCVPPAPDGGETLAVTWGPLLTPATCPTGYATPAANVAFADFDGGRASCGIGTCACPGPSGTASCTMQLEYHDDGICSVPSGMPADPMLVGVCTRVAGGSAAFARNRAVLQSGSVSCPPTGAPVTTKPPALWGTEVEACRPAAGAAAGPCGDAGLKPMPAVPSQALACYINTSGGACAKFYSTALTFSSTLAVNDTRNCGCSCRKTTDPSACAGGATSFYDTNNCAGGPTSTGNGPACRPIADFGSAVTLVTPPAVAAGAVTCSPDAGPTGSATPSSAPLRLCCMNKCDVCVTNAPVPGGPCATQYDACSANADCVSYRACVETTCGGVECGSCPPPDGGTGQALLQAFLTCRTTACDPVCP